MPPATSPDDLFLLLRDSLAPEQPLRSWADLNFANLISHSQGHGLEESHPALRKFYLNFSTDAYSLWDLLSRLSASSPSLPLLPSVKRVLSQLESTIKHVPAYSLKFVPEGASFPNLLAFNRRFAAIRGEALDDAKHWIDFDGDQSRDEILLVMQDCIQDLEQSLNMTNETKDQQYDSVPTPRWQPNYDVRALTTSMFKSLFAVRNCKVCKDVSTNLALASHRTTSETVEKLEFGLLFSPRPEMQKWQQAVVEVLAAKRPESGPRGRLTSNQTLAASCKGKTKLLKHLCKPLEEAIKEQVQLDLIVDDGNLWRTKPRTHTQLHGIVSLKDILSSEITGLTGKTKGILAVVLAHALLHLYGGPWMSDWSKEKILFLNQNGSISLQPYLSTASDYRNSEGSDEFFRLHQHPDILALGIMLLELHIGQPIETFVAPLGLPPEEINVNTPLVLAQAAMKKRQPEMYRNYRDAVKACLDPNFGFDFEEDDLDGFQQHIYMRIVKPLEDELWHGFGDHVDLRNIDNEVNCNFTVTSFGRPTRSASGGLSETSQLTHGNRGKGKAKYSAKKRLSSPQRPVKKPRQTLAMDKATHPEGFRVFDDESDDEQNTLKARKSSDWIQNIEDMWDLIADHVDPKRRVKIAIIDTGIDLEHQDIEQDRIKDIRSWVNGARGKADWNTKDCSGHGTHITGLLLTVAPEADIYVARVTDSKELKDPKHVADAIRYAALQWKVDIISISFGFERRIPEIESAIRNISRPCLVFAAASNDGGNRRQTHPADLQDVICVHSSDHLGNPSKFTPSPKRRSDNFCTLGEAIESAWPGPAGGCNLKIRSGTSFATPIAVGIAAFVMEYVKQRIRNRHILLRLRKPDGMKKVFCLMQDERAGYQYLAPWTFFRSDREEFVKQSILNALG